MDLRSFGWRLPAALACAALGACATSVVITPQVAETRSAVCEIHAPLRYEGKPEYLPTALIAAPGTSALVVRYRYEAQYGLKETNFFLTAVNPLTLVGFPTGSNDVVVTGHVEVLRGETTLRSYAAAAALTRSSTVFYEGESFTDMRRRGLLLVRDNLSHQLCQDQPLLTGMLAEAPPALTSPSTPP